MFYEIGNTIGMNHGITTLLGWFVLASLIVDEGCSIVGNFVEVGFKMPATLVKGLAVEDKLISKDESEEK